MPDHLRVSPKRLIYGTMRMGEVTRSIDEWVDFLIAIHALGITKLHSSSEYETFPMLCEILHHLERVENPPKFEHIVKLAEPSFDDAGFDVARLEQKVDGYCIALGVKYLADIQWMWRQNLDDDSVRLEQFYLAGPAMAAAVAALKSAGKIKRFLCFPYSLGFARAAIAMEMIDGLTVYRNADETEYDALIDDCAKRAKTALVIRPLNAGKVLTNDKVTAAQQVYSSLAKPGIEAGIISSNNLDHIRKLLV